MSDEDQKPAEHVYSKNYRDERRRAQRREQGKVFTGVWWRQALGEGLDQRPPPEVVDEWRVRCAIEPPPNGDPRPGYSAADRPRECPYRTTSATVMVRRQATVGERIHIGKRGRYFPAGHVDISLPRISMLEDPDEPA